MPSTVTLSLSALLLNLFAVLAQADEPPSPAPVTETPQTEEAPSSDIAARVDAALRRIADGERQEGQSALRAIVTEFPESVPRARWALGELLTAEGWLPYDRVVHQPGRWPELHQYHLQREKRGDSFRENLYLADGCRAHGLIDEERAHLMAALQFEPDFTEARLRLGHISVNGLWVSAEAIRALTRQQQQRSADLAEWQPRITRLKEQFSRHAGSPPRFAAVVQQLEGIRTPAAIPALEALLAPAGEREAELYLQWLGQVESVRASEALARQAVLNSSPRLRTLAQTLLADRRRDEYVPVLLGALETVNVEYSFAVQSWPLAILTTARRITFTSESQELIREQAVSVVPTDSPGIFWPDSSGVPGVALRGDLQSRSLLLQSMLADLLQQTRRARELADWRNASESVRQERVLRALQRSTGVTGNDSADDWWAWWRRENDIVAGGRMKVQSRYEQTWYVDTRQATPVSRVTRIPTPQGGPFSCLAPGTFVETEYGPRKIDEIRVGDRVLSQDAETGELQFKPVSRITTREQATLVDVVTQSEVIRCSLGHPFWVVGHGWRMARELIPGMQLHTLDGSQFEIVDVVSCGTGPVFNLVVADFGTFFAGRNRVYTHDVSPRQASDSVIPGLMKQFE